MYSRDFSKEARAAGSSGGAGIFSEMPIPIPGFVPNVTRGSISAASKVTSLSNTASASDGRLFQYATAASHSAPLGAYSLPRRYSMVVSSGAIRPPRAPISIDRLHNVMRCSMFKALIASPAYSTKYPVAPPVVIFAIRNNAISFAVTPSPRVPFTVILIVLGRGCKMHCVASTISTSEVPMPNATAPTAP